MLHGGSKGTIAAPAAASWPRGECLVCPCVCGGCARRGAHPSHPSALRTVASKRTQDKEAAHTHGSAQSGGNRRPSGPRQEQGFLLGAWPWRACVRLAADHHGMRIGVLL